MFAAKAARRASHMDVASTRCRLRRQDAEANGEAGPKGVPQERHVTREGALLLLIGHGKAPPSALRAASPLRKGSDHLGSAL
jgi:hypothetical protein